MEQEVQKMLKLIVSNIARDRSLEEIKYNLIFLKALRETDSIYSDYMTHILNIDNFKMTESEYRVALTGLPLSEGQHLFNS